MWTARRNKLKNTQKVDIFGKKTNNKTTTTTTKKKKKNKKKKKTEFLRFSQKNAIFENLLKILKIVQSQLPAEANSYIVLDIDH